MAGFKAKLLSPVVVVIEQMVTGSTVFDDDAREPVKQVARASQYTTRAQVSYSTTRGDDRWQGGQGGEASDALGHLVFLTRTLTNDGVTLAKGDRVVSIGGKTVEHYLSEQERAAHNDGTPGIEVWNFTDQNPTKN